MQPSPPNKLKQFLPGVFLLLFVVSLWVLAAFLMSSMFDPNEGNYNKPFLTTYLCTSSFSLYLLSSKATSAFRSFRSKYKFLAPNSSTTDDDAHDPSRDFYDPMPGDTAPPTQSAGLLDIPFQQENTTTTLPPLTKFQTMRLAAVFCVIWFIANWTNNAALALTSVSSATILCSTSGFLTLAFGTLFRVEKFNKFKLIAIICSLLGVILVTKADDKIQQGPGTSLPHRPPHPVIGDLIAFLSACSYATYVLLLKAAVGDESRLDIQLFFGYVGVFNIVAFWPFLIIFDRLGLETLQAPKGIKLISEILINMFITFSSDVLYVIGMLRTGPVTATLAMSLTIPLTILGDFYRGTVLGGIQALMGALLVGCSFAFVGWAERKDIMKSQEEKIDFASLENSI